MDSGPHGWSSSEQQSSQQWSADAHPINDGQSVIQSDSKSELPIEDKSTDSTESKNEMDLDGTKDRLQIQNEIGEVASSNLEKVMGEGTLIGRGVSCDVIK